MPYQESKHIKVLSESETHKDVIGEPSVKLHFHLVPCVLYHVLYYTAYYLAEARECLVTAKRDFSFFLHHTHFVSGACAKGGLHTNCFRYPKNRVYSTLMSDLGAPCLYVHRMISM